MQYFFNEAIFILMSSIEKIVYLSFIVICDVLTVFQLSYKSCGAVKILTYWSSQKKSFFYKYVGCFPAVYFAYFYSFDENFLITRFSLLYCFTFAGHAILHAFKQSPSYSLVFL